MFVTPVDEKQEIGDGVFENWSSNEDEFDKHTESDLFAIKELLLWLNAFLFVG